MMRRERDLKRWVVQFVDGQIAAIAHVNALMLATINDKDFARFKGLTVENWSKRDARRTGGRDARRADGPLFQRAIRQISTH
jgi:hypothetical protein